MIERKDEKWLDEQLQKAVDGTTPVFDAQAWKQKHRDEYQTLLARGRQAVGWGLPHRVWAAWRLRWGKPHPTGLGPWAGKLAVAAAIAVTVGLFVIGRNGHEPGGLIEPPGPVATSSPARMMSMMSLRMAYQQGGFEALDQQLHDTLDEFRPRSSSVPIRGLFSM